MIKIAIIPVILVLVILVSGCTQAPDVGDGTGSMISKQAEDQAAQAIEGELEQAVSGIDTQDIESALTDL